MNNKKRFLPKHEFIRNKIKMQHKEKKIAKYYDNKENSERESKEIQLDCDNLEISNSNTNSNTIEKDEIKEYYKQIHIKQHYKNKAQLENQIKNCLEYRKNHPIYKINSSLASRLNKELNKRNIKKTMSLRKLLGCTNTILIKHLENQFKENMSFENYGEWQVDHIKAISKFDLSNTEQQKECFNYINLQPLWEKDNKSKGNR